MNLDGRIPDEGACVELSVAYGIGKRCSGFKPDPRTESAVLDPNPMISGCMIKIFKDDDGERLKEEIRRYLSAHEL